MNQEKSFFEAIEDIETAFHLLRSQLDTLKVSMSDAQANKNEELKHELYWQYKDIEEKTHKLKELKKKLLKAYAESVDLDREYQKAILKGELLLKEL